MKNKMIAVALMLCIVMLACFSGCSKNNGATEGTTAAPVTTSATEATTQATEATTQATEAEKEITSYEYTNMGLSETLYLEAEGDKAGTVVLAEADINFPHIDGDDETIMNINSYYENILEEQTIYFREEFYLMANDSYEFARENESDFIEYSMQSDFWAACNDDKVFSLVRSHTEYSGGNSKHTTLACETFDKKTGSLVTFSQLFSVEKEEYMKKLVAIMTEQGKEKADLYEDYPQLLEEKFDERNFYVHKDDQTEEYFLVLVYQPYDIAPNSVGIVDFFINIDDIADILK